VVAQHMPPTFTRLFADRVNRLTQYNVREAEDGDILQAGSVYIAPGGMQTEVRRVGESLQIRVFAAGGSDLYAPSVDRLVKSASVACNERLLAIILTGMGDDGSEAVREVRARGGKTIAESPQTAIIFGMPGEAIRTGAVDEILKLTEIPDTIRRLCIGS
jgi:two-component system chemotaxis response regulator CheB